MGYSMFCETQIRDENSKILLPVFGVERHRLCTDGVGVTTLVGAYGCPLQCKYCINPQSWDPNKKGKIREFTPEELYDYLKIDDLYFQATGGGVTFGGGEALLHSDFYKEFRTVCGEKWRLTVETSLNVDRIQVEKIIGVIDDFIVDIKDINEKIYQAYTGKDNKKVLSNLDYLIENVPTQNIRVRVPGIPGYNEDEDKKKSLIYLKEKGIKMVDRFVYTVK